MQFVPSTSDTDSTYYVIRTLRGPKPWSRERSLLFLRRKSHLAELHQAELDQMFLVVIAQMNEVSEALDRIVNAEDVYAEGRVNAAGAWPGFGGR